MDVTIVWMRKIYFMLHAYITIAGFLRSLEKYGKTLGHYPAWKSPKKKFLLC